MDIYQLGKDIGDILARLRSVERELQDIKAKSGVTENGNWYFLYRDSQGNENRSGPYATQVACEQGAVAEIQSGSVLVQDCYQLRRLTHSVPCRCPKTDSRILHLTPFEEAKAEAGTNPFPPPFWWGCQLAHAGSGHCQDSQYWVIDPKFYAWKNTFGPYASIDAGKYNFYMQVQITGEGNPSYSEPDYGPIPLYIDAVYNGGNSFIQNLSMSWSDYQANLQKQGGVFSAQLTNAPGPPLVVPSGVKDLEIRSHFNTTLTSVQVNYLRLVKVG